MQAMPKLEHTKSTRGCLRCKRRKVKCDEIHPICGACGRHNVDCKYIDHDDSISAKRPRKKSTYLDEIRSEEASSTPASASSTPFDRDHGPNSDRNLELRLMLHFALSTAPSISADALHVWQEIVPYLGLKHQFLLDTLLASAALHIARINPDDIEASLASRVYFDRGLEGQTQALRDLTDDSSVAEALFCNVGLIAWHALALSGSAPDFSFIDWYRVASGFRTVLVAAGPAIGSSRLLGTVFTQQPGLLDDKVMFADEYRHDFRHILDYRPELDTISIIDRAIYEQTITYIGTIYGAVAKRQEGAHATFRRIFVFPARIDERFSAMVEARTPRALVILAHLFAVIKLFHDDRWWTKNVPERHVTSIHAAIPEVWHPLMDYPLRLCHLDLQLRPSP